MFCRDALRTLEAVASFPAPSGVGQVLRDSKCCFVVTPAGDRDDNNDFLPFGHRWEAQSFRFSNEVWVIEGTAK